MAADIVPFRRSFDPLARDAEARFDRVVQRFSLLSARRSECQRTIAEIEHQFVDDDLTSRRGTTLCAEGRRRRLWHFVCLNRQIEAIDAERERLQLELRMMNEALETWAREAYAADIAALPSDAAAYDPKPITRH